MFKKLSDRLGIIHLTGEKDYQLMSDTYKNAGIESFVKPFVEEMSIIYAASDFALSLSGGIAIAEMSAFGLPMILVPYPNAADNHQFFNALEVQQSCAGVIINQDNLTQKIEMIVKEFLTKTSLLERLSQHAKCLTKDKAGRTILAQLERTIIKDKDKHISPSLHPRTF